MQRVTSAHNPRLREAARLLASARDRRKASRCVLEGEHIVAVYAERVGPPETIVLADDVLERPGVRGLVERLPSTSILVIPAALFTQLLPAPTGIGVIAVVPTPHDAKPRACRFSMLLEELQDPGNVGSILRTAAAAGVEQVLLSRHCAFAWSPKVLRAGQGAHFHLAIVEDVDLGEWCRAFARDGGRVAGAVVEGGNPIYDVALLEPLALVIGNEGAGLSAALQQTLSARITIPMPGGMESLNAAAAAAVCAFECVRQRRAAGGA